MKRSSGIRWLYGELPSLVSEGVLSPEAADDLRRHYGEPGEGAGPVRVALALSASLGAVLIGSGIILLLAHNWDDLSRPARTILSIAPLLIAQALSAWCILRWQSAAAWREGAATLQLLTVGASIALVSQTYHIPWELQDILLIWMLLSVPLVYLLDATLPAILYLAGVAVWAGYVHGKGGYQQFYFLFIAAVIPHLLRLIRENRYGQRAVWLSWVLVLSLTCILGFVLEAALPGIWIGVYSAFFAVLYLGGATWFGEAPSSWQRPFQSLGAMGTAAVAFLLTNSWPWKEIGWNHYRHAENYRELAGYFDLVLLAALLAAAFVLLLKSIVDRRLLRSLFGAAPFLAVLGYLLTAAVDAPSPPMVLFNLYLFALGLLTAVSGVRAGRMGTVNAGMLMLSALILLRFFDSDLPFLARGLGFIAVGIGFFLTNVILLARRMKGAAA